jgi:hypothetical protein
MMTGDCDGGLAPHVSRAVLRRRVLPADEDGFPLVLRHHIRFNFIVGCLRGLMKTVIDAAVTAATLAFFIAAVSEILAACW